MVGRWLCWANERSTWTHFRVERKSLFLMWLEERGELLKISVHISSQNSFLKAKMHVVFGLLCLALSALTHTCRRLACDTQASIWLENAVASLPISVPPELTLCFCIVVRKWLKDYRCMFLTLIPPDILEEPESFHGNLLFTYLVNLCEKSEGVIGGH